MLMIPITTADLHGLTLFIVAWHHHAPIQNGSAELKSHFRAVFIIKKNYWVLGNSQTII